MQATQTGSGNECCGNEVPRGGCGLRMRLYEEGLVNEASEEGLVCEVQ